MQIRRTLLTRILINSLSHHSKTGRSLSKYTTTEKRISKVAPVNRIESAMLISAENA